MKGFWSDFFHTTRSVYRVQHAARTFLAFASGSPKRIAKLYERRLFYKAFVRVANKILK